MSDTTTIDDRSRLAELEREVERGKISRDTWALAIFAFAGFALLASIVGAGFGTRAIDESRDSVAAAGAAANSASVEADRSEFAIDLSSDRLAAGGEVVVSNHGTGVHNLAGRDTNVVSSDLSAGQSTTLDLGALEGGTYGFYCTLPGHAQAGMTAQLTIEGHGDTHAAAGEHGTHGIGAGDGATSPAYRSPRISTSRRTCPWSSTTPVSSGSASTARASRPPRPSSPGPATGSMWSTTTRTRPFPARSCSS